MVDSCANDFLMNNSVFDDVNGITIRTTGVNNIVNNVVAWNTGQGIWLNGWDNE